MKVSVSAVAFLAMMIAGAEASEFAVVSKTRVEGEMLPAPPSTANCETRCQTVDRCVAYRLSRDGILRRQLNRAGRQVAVRNAPRRQRARWRFRAAALSDAAGALSGKSCVDHRVLRMRDRVGISAAYGGTT
jgi:hypothetical protein